VVDELVPAPLEAGDAELGAALDDDEEPHPALTAASTPDARTTISARFMHAIVGDPT
jgi:hypothetical protein